MVFNIQGLTSLLFFLCPQQLNPFKSALFPPKFFILNNFLKRDIGGLGRNPYFFNLISRSQPGDAIERIHRLQPAHHQTLEKEHRPRNSLEYSLTCHKSESEQSRKSTRQRYTHRLVCKSWKRSPPEIL